LGPSAEPSPALETGEKNNSKIWIKTYQYGSSDAELELVSCFATGEQSGYLARCGVIPSPGLSSCCVSTLLLAPEWNSDL
jgi:hypothetical protein